MKRSLLPLEQVASGMCLADAVQDVHGVVLLAAGCKLTERLIEVLRQRGLQQVWIEEVETLSAAEREARRQAVRDRLARLFRHAGAGEADRQLFDSVLAYRLGRIG